MNRKFTDGLYYILMFALIATVSLILLTLMLENGGDKRNSPVAFVLAHLFAGRLTGIRWLLAVTLGALFTCTACTAHYRLAGGGRRMENGAFGNARFDTPHERAQLYHYVRYHKATTPGFTLAFDRHGCEVDTSLQTVMLICPPGGGKTKSLLIPTLLYNAVVNGNTGGNGASILSVDCKGEEYRTTRGFLQEHGYATLLLDFRDPRHSLQYNLLFAVNRYMEKARRETDPGCVLEARAMAERQAKRLADSICSTTELAGHDDNPFFTETAKGLITAMILVVSEFGEPEERHIVSVFRLIVELNGLLQSDEKNQKSRLGTLLDLLPGDVRAKLYAGAATSADVRTGMNVFSSALAKLLTFLDAQMEQMICGQSPGLTAEEFLEKPTCIYLVLPDEDTTAHFFAALFLEQMTTTLVHMASVSPSQELPRPVLVLWDEFGQSPRCKNLRNWVSAWRSRRIRLLMALQTESQLEAIYGRSVADVVLKNTQIRMYSNLGSEETAQKLSKEFGHYTIVTQSVTDSGRSGSRSQSTTGKPLLSPEEIGALPLGTWIIKANNHHPILAKLCTYDRVWKLEPAPFDGEPRPVKPVSYLTEQKLRERYLPPEQIPQDPLRDLLEPVKPTPFKNRKPINTSKGENTV